MLKTPQELENLSQEELLAYFLTLNEQEKITIQAEFDLRAIRHFAKENPTYENSGFKCSREQYEQLKLAFQPVDNSKPQEPFQAKIVPMNRKTRRSNRII